eukprot:Skav208920  [mRNA]  locus=scaffold787:97684:99849:+ [translate_table: standard]
MVSFDVGPAGDLGSLSAFLGVSNAPSKPAKTGLRQGIPLSDINSTNSTLLNKKVAFRMLKQLGCEVHKLDEMNFAEVTLSKQPVLFKMLVELGHRPCKNEEGDVVVRVKEQRPRKPEELVAALFAPKAKPKICPESNGSGDRRLRPADEAQLVKRLYVPKLPNCKNALPGKDSPGAPRRTAAEQRAYLEKLSKPRDSELSDGPEEFRDIAGLGHSRIAWPKFSSPSLSKPKGRKTKGSKGPLSKAGQLLLFECPVLFEGDESFMTEESGESQDPTDVGGRDSGEGEEPLSRSPVGLGPNLEAISLRAERFEDSAKLDVAKPSKPSRSAKRERLEELAKPRPLKARNEDCRACAAPCRSPRSQREACARLSQPRSKPDAIYAADSDDFDERQVQVIPSMLAQCSPRLERIDEEDAEGAKATPQQKANTSFVSVSRSQRGQCSTISHGVMPEQGKPSFLDGDKDLAKGEAMLDDIDALYSQLICGSNNADSLDFQANCSDTASQPTYLPASHETGLPPDSNLDSEDLLLAIDQLFHQMIDGGTTSAERCASEQSADVANSSHSTPETVPTEGCAAESGQELQTELPVLLEEVLWSALLLVRAGRASEVVAELPLTEIKAAMAAIDSASDSPLFSLQQRLAVELPELSLGASDAASAAVLVPCLRKARDNLLNFVSKKGLVLLHLFAASQFSTPLYFASISTSQQLVICPTLAGCARPLDLQWH